MKTLLQLVTIAALLISIGSCTFAKSSIHEIQGLIWALIATVGLVGCSLLAFMERVVNDAAEEKRRALRDTRPCPKCHERIAFDVTKCRQCGADVPVGTRPPPPKPTRWQRIFG